MWLLLYITKEGKEVETLLAAINKRDYSLCADEIRLDISTKLRAAPDERKRENQATTKNKGGNVRFKASLSDDQASGDLESKMEVIKYMELENKADEEKAKKNFGLTSVPALLHLDIKDKQVLEVYYREDIFLDDFVLDDF